MNISLITASMSFLTALITLANTMTAIKQKQKDINILQQSNSATISKNNIIGNINISQSNSRSESQNYNEETWKKRSEQYKMVISLEIIVITLFPFFILVTWSHSPIPSMLLILSKTIPISFLLLSILNAGNLFLFFKLHVFHFRNVQDSGITNFIHSISRIIWPISIGFSFILSFIVFSHALKANIFILLLMFLITILGTKIFGEMVLAGTMYNVNNIKNIFIHFLFWILTIGVPIFFFIN
ncbi:hypothetical protein [Pediococcus claussenii]|uniref:Membrane protein n=1 Tax=Pediococcus claussenii (strain ATCC BAA-344 / DSM 14800 / JCM 18046 / KCTC 3811 / LMG 21948 / P06) TaxID=701521 RepID=G8PD08_PEDCP|nr:hypothetical protein [Pediococcus claussenii]AEV95143.1 putative membrane protein [Pediococcus claussenii ATCC BAA-344]ANZ70326.1 hypothetical protein AYR57_08355 [Pediococcus claussenii]ANZ72142.1 hypothetical protein AYR58_08355 [Pediococcus claussenii]KRN19674.1 hypothetical protein IV79_GL001392 [Pediococcus claussenii]